VQAAGMYNTLLASDDPAIVVECLNGYRLREAVPSNLGEYNVPLGIPEILSVGNDITLVTYGSCVRIAEEALALLSKEGISVELIDVQTLLPFDRLHSIVKSLQKTNRLVVLDEDVPGGASAFILQQILEVQGGYRHLDSQPVTIAAAENRGAYGSEGDYFCKPSVEDVVEKIYDLMHEAKPKEFPRY
jgi:2-oxoisovalerate dehydrogenase E1 component